jgi:pimeloyl-ACP methyl ester carboxylesterase
MAKPTILMIHGFRGNHFGLKYIASELREKYEIIIPDLPGHGTEPPMRNQKHNIEGYAAFFENYIKKNHLENFFLIGHSYGAIVAAKLAANHPEGIRKLVLINPVSQSSKFIASLGILYYRFGLGLPFGLDLNFFYSKLINRIETSLLLRTKDKKLRKQIYQYHLDNLKINPYYRQVIEEAFYSVVQNNILLDAQNIHLPTLIIAGDLDDLAPVEKQKRLWQAISDSQLKIIPEVGHLTHYEKSKETANHILKFLDESRQNF